MIQKQWYVCCAHTMLWYFRKLLCNCNQLIKVAAIGYYSSSKVHNWVKEEIVTRLFFSAAAVCPDLFAKMAGCLRHTIRQRLVITNQQVFFLYYLFIVVYIASIISDRFLLLYEFSSTNKYAQWIHNMLANKVNKMRWCSQSI